MRHLAVLLLVLVTSSLASRRYSSTKSGGGGGGGGGDSAVGDWSVRDAGGKKCIGLKAQITLQLMYYTKEPDEGEKDATIDVPADSTVKGSSCDETVQIGSDGIQSQVLQLNWPHNTGWSLRLAFTRDKRLTFNTDDFTLFQVNLTANYNSMPDKFNVTGNDRVHTYVQLVDLANPPDIATTLFSKIDTSYYCPKSSQAFKINDDVTQGPTALIRLSSLQVQAYMNTNDFGETVTCFADDHSIDIVPVAVAAALAGLIILTLAIYLCYRCRLPPEVIHLTAPEHGEGDHLHKGHGGGHGGDNGHNANGHSNGGHHHAAEESAWGIHDNGGFAEEEKF